MKILKSFFFVGFSERRFSQVGRTGASFVHSATSFLHCGHEQNGTLRGVQAKVATQEEKVRNVLDVV